MALDLADTLTDDLGPERKLKSRIRLRLIEPHERERFDALLTQEHYLHNPSAVGAVLRYVVTEQDQWLALLVFCSPALHLKPRDRWLQWKPTEVAQRRHLIAQNSRFLIRVKAQAYPNLASFILGLVARRIRQDWQEAFGHPVLALESFVDPQRFRGTCYRAAGWQRLGPTRGYQRSYQDFYEDAQHPKELWVRALSPRDLRVLRQTQLPETLRAADAKAPPPACPVPTQALNSLWGHFQCYLKDPRDARGRRHPLNSLLTLIALAVCAGCHGPEAIADFARSLNHHQRRRLRCRPRPGKAREYDVPSVDTFRRCLKAVNSPELAQSLIRWMKTQDPDRPVSVHFDGKVLKGTRPAPAGDPKTFEAHVPAEIDPQAQKPKANQALTLVNFLTDEQRLIQQVAVPRNTNEEAAVAAALGAMDLTGYRVTFDAAHMVKASLRQLTFSNGADYAGRIKGNQPTALAKAQQLLPGDVPPSTGVDRERAWADHHLPRLASLDRSLGPEPGGRDTPAAH
jgi:hypothetical protein